MSTVKQAAREEAGKRWPGDEWDGLVKRGTFIAGATWQAARMPSVERVAEVLTTHQRRDISSCTCGWARLGYSFTEHQAEQVVAL